MRVGTGKRGEAPQNVRTVKNHSLYAQAGYAFPRILIRRERASSSRFSASSQQSRKANVASIFRTTSGAIPVSDPRLKAASIPRLSSEGSRVGTDITGFNTGRNFTFGASGEPEDFNGT